jgi:thiol:disulfide interchange protein
MKRVLLSALAFVFATGISLSCFAQKPTDYNTAYQAAQDGKKPLLVLVTAEWCPPCKVMKNTTIPELMQKQAFKNFYYSTVDLDRDQKLARQLIGDRGVPQLIMYEKKNDKWIRRYLRGIQTPETVEAFVAQAGAVRTANVSSNLVDK